MTYGTDPLQQYIDQGGIKPLDELIEKYGQDIPAFLGEEVMQYGQFDAGSGMEQYYLPARRIIVATRSIQSRVDYGSTVTSKEADLLVQAVTCAPDQFDAVWEKYVNEILQSGGQEIIDEQRAAYQEGAYRGFYPMEK